MNTKNTTSTSNASNTAKDLGREDKRLILLCFERALDEGLTDENKEIAQYIADSYRAAVIGEAEAPQKATPFFLLAQGFVLGMGEGLRLADIFNCAKDKH
jgi:hypothetical protein